MCLLNRDCSSLTPLHTLYILAINKNWLWRMENVLLTSFWGKFSTLYRDFMFIVQHFPFAKSFWQPDLVSENNEILSIFIRQMNKTFEHVWHFCSIDWFGVWEGYVYFWNQLYHLFIYFLAEIFVTGSLSRLIECNKMTTFVFKNAQKFLISLYMRPFKKTFGFCDGCQHFRVHHMLFFCSSFSWT